MNPIRNTVSGEVKQVPVEEIINQMDPEVQGAVRDLFNRYKGIALFQNQDFCSSQFGRLQVLAIGGASVPIPEVLATYRLGTLPSNFAYPIQYAMREED